uniref:C2H2-type domain-containing protein n=1 Tax=Gongylonema pulchrum TaxID=637853 RepID=A0A183CVM1_9BILA
LFLVKILILGCSGNETLRSHMFRIHSISRMFMCRCCNWAYPDKTSLHIHMQSMLRNGTPGDVSVLARSSNDGPGMAGFVGEMSPQELEGSPSASPPEACDSETSSSELTSVKGSLFGNGIMNGSIFPATLRNSENFLRFGAKPDNLLSQISPETAGGSWLTAWLANSAFSAAAPFTSANLLTAGNEPLHYNSFILLLNAVINFFDKDTKKSSNGSSLDDLLEKKGLNVVRNHRNKRKATKPQQLRISTALPAADDDDEEFVTPPQKQNLMEKAAKTDDSGKAASSDSNETVAAAVETRTSPNGITLVDASTSPIKCSHCTVKFLFYIIPKLFYAQNFISVNDE